MKNFLIVSLFVVLMLAFVGCDNGEPPPKPTPVPTEDTRPLVQKAEIRTAEYKISGKNFNCEILRPEFVNLPDEEAEHEINVEINKAIEPYIKEIDVVSEGLTDSDTANADFETKSFFYNVIYDRYDTEPYVSLIISQDYYTGGLRSNKWKDMYTIDLDELKIISLKDLCEIDVFANFKRRIVDEINKQAEAANITLMGGPGLLSISDSQKFYIKDGELYIYFEAGLIAPYQNGELSFKMPFQLNGKYFEP